MRTYNFESILNWNKGPSYIMLICLSYHCANAQWNNKKLCYNKTMYYYTYSTLKVWLAENLQRCYLRKVTNYRQILLNNSFGKTFVSLYFWFKNLMSGRPLISKSWMSPDRRWISSQYTPSSAAFQVSQGYVHELYGDQNLGRDLSLSFDLRLKSLPKFWSLVR